MIFAFLLLLISSFLISAFNLVSTWLSLPLFLISTFGLLWEIGRFLKHLLFYRRLSETHNLLWLKRGYQANNFSNGIHQADLAFTKDVVIVTTDEECYRLTYAELRSIIIFNGQQLSLIETSVLADQLGVSSGEQVYAQIYNLLEKYHQYRKRTFVLLSLEGGKETQYKFGPVYNPLIFFFDCSRHELDQLVKLNSIANKLHDYSKLLK